MNMLETPKWISGDGKNSDIVISTRARLARSLINYPFPFKCDNKQLESAASEIKIASDKLTCYFEDISILDMSNLSTQQQNWMIDAHIASLEHVNAGKGRFIIMEPGGRFSIMINEEDHLRIQAIESGLALETCWDMVDKADTLLSDQLSFGYSEQYGFLTASPSNVGTGLRLSVLIHLAGLAFLNKLKTNLRAAYDLGVAVRGLYGEGSSSDGDLFQVSNELTLGVSESGLLDRVRSLAVFLLKEEQKARNEIYHEKLDIIQAQAVNALRILQHARSIMPSRALGLLSIIRLAFCLGLIKNCNISLFNQLLAGIEAHAGEDFNAGVNRAALLRKKLAHLCVEELELW